MENSTHITFPTRSTSTLLRRKPSGTRDGQHTLRTAEIAGEAPLVIVPRDHFHPVAFQNHGGQIIHDRRTVFRIHARAWIVVHSKKTLPLVKLSLHTKLFPSLSLPQTGHFQTISSVPVCEQPSFTLLHTFTTIVTRPGETFSLFKGTLKRSHYCTIPYASSSSPPPTKQRSRNGSDLITIAANHTRRVR